MCKGQTVCLTMNQLLQYLFNLFEKSRKCCFTLFCYENDQYKAVNLEKCLSLLQILFDFTPLI